jgi:hypothetical protein
LKKCCGSDRDTAYCGNCGKRLAVSLLEQLLQHCLRQAKATATVAGTYKLNCRSNRAIERAQARADRWAAWAAEIKRILAEKPE